LECRAFSPTISWEKQKALPGSSASLRKTIDGLVHREGTIAATRNELDCWVWALPQPRIMAMEATIFTGWIYDHLLPHAEQVKVAHPLIEVIATAGLAKRNPITLPREIDNPGEPDSDIPGAVGCNW
jgi:hypothetical protein